MTTKIKRIIADVIDFYIIVFIASVIVLIITLGKMDISFFSISVYIISFFILLLSKDVIFKNASIGKKMFKLKIVKDNQNQKVELGILIKRNLTLLLLPIEVLLLLFNEKRLGDIIAKTIVVNDKIV